MHTAIVLYLSGPLALYLLGVVAVAYAGLRHRAPGARVWPLLSMGLRWPFLLVGAAIEQCRPADDPSDWS